jgi:uncharacterized membrane protein YdjX (TVP38/TMEM64 family)
LQLIIIVIQQVVIIAVSPIRAVGGITGFQLSLLGTAAGSTRPSETARGFLQQWRANTVHVVGKVTDCTIDRVVARKQGIVSIFAGFMVVFNALAVENRNDAVGVNEVTAHPPGRKEWGGARIE